jgi:hypothetical protein
VIDWYQIPRGAKLANEAAVRPVLVAAGRLTFSAAGSAAMKIMLSAAGKRLLKRARQIKLTVKGTFTPTGGMAIAASRTLILKR